MIRMVSEVDENDDVDVGATNRLVMSNMFNPDGPVGVGIINSMGISNMSNLDDSVGGGIINNIVVSNMFNLDNPVDTMNYAKSKIPETFEGFARHIQNPNDTDKHKN